MTPSRQPVQRRAWAPLGVMALLGLVAGLLIGHDAVRTISSGKAVPAPGQPAGATTTDGADGEGDRRGRKTAAVGRVRSGYRFLLTEQGGDGPIRWDPCDPVRYKVALRGGVPESEIAEVRAAFDEVSEALGGAVYHYDGTTDVVPDAVDDSAKAGADIVLAFAEPGSGDDRSSLLTGWEAGRGGFAAVTSKGPDGVTRQRPTNGSVVIDSTKWAVMSRHDRTVLYLHEIGHVVGLDHPKDDHQIMSSGAYDLPPRYQDGDLAGFARLGRQAGCG
jgi:hypothetical protein